MLSKLVSYHKGSGSKRCRSLWDLWQEKGHWNNILFEIYGFPLSVTFQQRSYSFIPHIFIYTSHPLH